MVLLRKKYAVLLKLSAYLETQLMTSIIFFPPCVLTHEMSNLALATCLFCTGRRRGGIGGVSHDAANFSM